MNKDILTRITTKKNYQGQFYALFTGTRNLVVNDKREEICFDTRKQVRDYIGNNWDAIRAYN